MRTGVKMLCVLLLFGATAGFAQKVGTSSFQFLKVMPVARATALGDAFVTMAAGADALFWNPAGVALVTGHQLSSTYTLWLFDTRQTAIGYALPLGDVGSLGLQLQYVDYGDIEETNVENLKFVGSQGNQVYNPGLTGNTFSPSALVIGATFARPFTENFCVGVTAKFVHESLYGSNTFTVVNPSTGATEEYRTYASVLMFDFGMRYRTGYRSVELAASVQNFGAQVKFAKEGSPAPLAFRLGVAADVMGPDALVMINETNRLSVAFDLFQPNDYAQQMHAGMEYRFAGVFALRGGYKFNYDNDGLTLGAGVNTDLAGVNLSFDYSFGKMGEYLGNVHRISLGALLR